jgi:hypothetical protein
LRQLRPGAVSCGTLQQFARFRYFGEFKQPVRALADALDALSMKTARP